MGIFLKVAMLPTMCSCKHFSGPTCPLQHLLQLAVLRLNQVLDAVLLLLQGLPLHAQPRQCLSCGGQLRPLLMQRRTQVDNCSLSVCDNAESPGADLSSS